MPDILTVRSTSDIGQRTVAGSEGNDLIVGARLADGNGVQIDGRGGDDILVGSIGADTLIGGSGEDLLMGGLGSDTYFASSAAGSRTYIVDHGGNDVLVLDGEIVGDGRASYRYLRDTLSLTVGAAGAIVEIIGHYGQLAGSGAGRIETIIDGSGGTCSAFC